MSDSLGPDWTESSDEPDLGPNCLHMLSASDKVGASKQRMWNNSGVNWKLYDDLAPRFKLCSAELNSTEHDIQIVHKW